MVKEVEEKYITESELGDNVWGFSNCPGEGEIEQGTQWLYVDTPSSLACHIFSEPGPSSGINIDADTDTMQGRAKKVNTVPAS